jgi:hypothetical protein
MLPLRRVQASKAFEFISRVIMVGLVLLAAQALWLLYR